MTGEGLVCCGVGMSEPASSVLAPSLPGWSPVGMWRRLDPRWAIAGILFFYLLLGFTVLGFNRAPSQALVTTLSACLLEVVLARVFKKIWILPLSAMITSFSLSLLLNYSHDYYLLLIPVFFAIGSKYVVTFEGKHALNPAQAGVTLSLLFAGTLITQAPAYQWNGIESLAVFMVLLALTFLMPKIQRGPLVVSFLLAFTACTALRAMIMRWHLPFETLFLGTLSSPAFILFTFFMITDPATSPHPKKEQIKVGILLALVDLAFHAVQSYFTFFYAAFTLSMYRWASRHLRAAWVAPSRVGYLSEHFWRSGYWRQPVTLGALAVGSVLTYQHILAPTLSVNQLPWTFRAMPGTHTTIDPKLGDVLTRVDPGIQHVAKWLLSVGDSVAAGDYDQDGQVDLFFTFTLKQDQDRNALYKNLGGFRFERVHLPAIVAKTEDLERFGVPSGALFADYDNDGDLDLLITYLSGRPILLANRLKETGIAQFDDVSEAAGLTHWSNAMTANFLDINRDGRLDLVVGNVVPEVLSGYEVPPPLNLFALPKPEYEGDDRPFAFMHSSWHLANNGGLNDIYLQTAEGRFERQDSQAWGLSHTRWSLVIGTADLNQDGWTDIYVANDFGPDNLYYNLSGKKFENIEGESFGSVGRDTYKGMNASVADLDNNGWLDVYVSNVHQALQAEGSLAWMFGPSTDPFRPILEDRATQLGILNEQRFGWGASLTDFDADGWVDIAQANGMVDDTPDKLYEKCPDYWYVNEKIARSPPSIHTKANLWGDIRGRCIYGKELNRLYLNGGPGRGRRFVDVAEKVGMTARTNSRGMAAADLDNDGRQDLVVTHQFAAPTIYRNVGEGPSYPSWVRFQLEGDGTRCNRDGLGSTVRVIADGVPTQLREHQGTTGFSAQDDRRLYFGLGTTQKPVTAEVIWCGGARERYENLALGQTHLLRQSLAP